MDTKSALTSVFKNCLDTLRDSEGITGEKAMRNMSYLLILKLIEPHLGRDIDIDNFEYDLSHIDTDMIEMHRKKLLEIVRFSALSNENEDNLPANIQYLWDDVLSNHPSTRSIFMKGKGFDIQHKYTYTRLIEKLNSIDLTNTEYDVLGNAYEEVIQDIMTGKVLGQFFTQPLLKKMMVKLINPQILPDGKIETCCDPTMGTGGFLITYLQDILKKAEVKNINPDWDFIKTEGLFGKELDPDTYQLAVSNILIYSGHMFGKLEQGDSIRYPIVKKFDNILANPPFGITGLKYDDFVSAIKNEYIPIKSSNAVSLFIQAIIYMLRVGGKCAIVLPDGKDLFSANSTLVLIRKYLMKTCDLKEIIYLPSGIFTYTPIRTCVAFFVKKREGVDVLTVNAKKTKTVDKYVFSEEHQTAKVSFYEYNVVEDVKTLLVEVPIETISKNSYSLNYTMYLEGEPEPAFNPSVAFKTLGEVCKFMPISKRAAAYGKPVGTYPFFTSSSKCTKFCDEFDYENECLIIGSGGEPNVKYSGKFSCSGHNFVMTTVDGTICKYIYYYLLHNIDILKKGFVGVGLQNLSKEFVKNLKIPIPSLEQQLSTIERCENCNSEQEKMKKDMEDLKQRMDLSKKDIFSFIQNSLQ